LPGIAVDRRDTDESSDTPSIELTEFGQIGNQGRLLLGSGVMEARGGSSGMMAVADGRS
jgi:hypothetical protein